MNIFIIIFQIPEKEREAQMVGFIKENRPWARITDNVWCVKDDDNVKTADVRDALNSKFSLQSTERLMVINITKSAWASYYLPKEVADWLKE